MNFRKCVFVGLVLMVALLSCRVFDQAGTQLPVTSPETPSSPSPTWTIEEIDQFQVAQDDSEIHKPSEITPFPDAPVPPALLVAYIKNSEIWLWRADGSKNQLTTTGMVQALRLSHDGKVIAYSRQIDDFHAELWAVNIDGSNNRRLVSIYDLDEMAAEVRDPNAIAINPYHFDWVSGAHTVAFNTQQVYDGPGLVLLDDLRLVDADSIEIRTLLPPSQGGEFSYAPNGKKISISTPTMVSLIDPDGGNRQNILPYDQVITYSEYRYYANPIWSPDSTFLRVAIPPIDPLSENIMPTSLWFIPTDGSLAYQTGSVYAEPFFSSEVAFSPDLSMIIFLRESGIPSDNTSELMIAKTDGSGEWAYDKAPLVRFSGWGSDSVHFVFMKGDESEVQLGSVLEASAPINSDPRGILDVRWVNDELYLYLKENISTFDLVLESLNGDSIVIDSIPAPPQGFDFILAG